MAYPSLPHYWVPAHPSCINRFQAYHILNTACQTRTMSVHPLSGHLCFVYQRAHLKPRNQHRSISPKLNANVPVTRHSNRYVASNSLPHFWIPEYTCQANGLTSYHLVTTEASVPIPDDQIPVVKFVLSLNTSKPAPQKQTSGILLAPTLLDTTAFLPQKWSRHVALPTSLGAGAPLIYRCCRQRDFRQQFNFFIYPSLTIPVFSFIYDLTITVTAIMEFR